MADGLRTRYPCEKCVHEADHAQLIRELRSAIARAQRRGMRGLHVPELPAIYVDCEGRYSPPSQVLRK